MVTMIEIIAIVHVGAVFLVNALVFGNQFHSISIDLRISKAQHVMRTASMTLAMPAVRGLDR